MQYEDKDFNDYINIANISDVENLASIKLIKSSCELSEESHTGKASSSVEKPWPSCFPLHEFEQEIKAFLVNKDTKLNNLPSRIRKKIVSALANEIIKFTSYPTA